MASSVFLTRNYTQINNYKYTKDLILHDCESISTIISTSRNYFELLQENQKQLPLNLNQSLHFYRDLDLIKY